MTNQDPMLVVTGRCRIAFPSLFEKTPRAKGMNDKLAYQAVALIPPEHDLKPFQEAMKAAAMAKWGQVPSDLNRDKLALKPCSSKANKPAGYEDGWHFVNAASQYQPQVLDVDGSEIESIQAGKIYGGCYCRFILTAYAWDNIGGKGVSFSLDAVQFLEDGERIGGGRVDARDVFAPISTASQPADTGAAAPASGGNPSDDLFG